MEGTEILEHSAEEASGVGGAGCCASQRWHRGGFTRPGAHIRRHGGDQPEAKSHGTSREQVEETIGLKTIKT